MSLLPLSAIFAPIKMYLYGALAALLLGLGIAAYVHVLHVGEAKIEAKDKVIEEQRTAIANAAELHTKDVQALAQKLSDDIGETFETTIAKPIVDSPHVVCVKPAATSRGSQLPGASGSAPGDHGEANGPSQDSGDIGPPLDIVGRDADAQITALQEQVQTLIDAMNGKAK